VRGKNDFEEELIACLTIASDEQQCAQRKSKLLACLIPQFDCAVPTARSHLARVDWTPLTTNRNLIVTLELPDGGADENEKERAEQDTRERLCTEHLQKRAVQYLCKAATPNKSGLT
jgi:hypothetical protein